MAASRGIKRTEHDLLTEVMMMRADMPKLGVLVVEGETDINFFEKRYRRRCHVLAAGGKRIALRLAELADEHDVPLLFIFVDADFDRQLGRIRESARIVYTDKNDLECTILSFSALEDLARELAPSHALDDLVRRAGARDLRALLYNRAAVIGKRRYASELGRLSLNFKEIPFDELLHPETFEWDLRLLVEWLTERNAGNKHLPRLDDLVATIDGQQHDECDLCCGHDLVELLAVVSKRVGAAHNRDPWSSKNIEATLRISFGADDFATTQMALKLLAILAV